MRGLLWAVIFVLPFWIALIVWLRPKTGVLRSPPTEFVIQPIPSKGARTPSTGAIFEPVVLPPAAAYS